MAVPQKAARKKSGGMTRLMSRLSDISSETEEQLDEDGISLYSNDQVKALDGGFFEFCRAVSIVESLPNRGYDSTDGQPKRRGTLPEVLLQNFSAIEFEDKRELSKKEKDMLYIEAMYTIKHKIGAENKVKVPALSVDEQYNYIRSVFNVTDKQHARLLEITDRVQAPIIILNVTVEEARNLEAKDADGFSDPYCMLGLIPGSRVSDLDNEQSGKEGKEGKTLMRKFSSSLRDRFKSKNSKDELKPIIPAKYIQSTKVISNSLSPVWSEKFKFDVDTIEFDKLHVDVWDHDDEDSVYDAAKSLNQVQNMKGLGRVFKQIAQSARSGSGDSVDDFLGAVDIPLHDIPSTGTTEWYDLCGRSSRSKVQGQIRLSLNLGTREDHGIAIDDNYNDVRQHEDLLTLFIEYERSKFSSCMSDWDGALSDAATVILHQHAIQGDITDTQQAYCQWLAYSEQFKRNMFHPNKLWAIISKLDNHWNVATLSGEETECTLSKSFRSFIEYFLTLIENIRQLFPVSNHKSADLLTSLLEVVSLLINSEVFSHCCSTDDDFNVILAQHVKNGTRNFYTKVSAVLCTTTELRVEKKVEEMILLSQLLYKDLKSTVEFYNPIFDSTLHFPYFDPVYRVLERKLSCEVRKILDEDLSSILLSRIPNVDDSETPDFRRSSVGSRASIDSRETERRRAAENKLVDARRLLISSVLSLYYLIQKIYKLRVNLKGHRDSLHINRYQDWFSRTIQEWLMISKTKLEARIRHAVTEDKEILIKLRKVDDNFECSTSSVDVVNCYTQISEFWRNLEWMNPEESFAFSLKLYDDMCQSAVVYAELLHHKMKKNAYFDDEGQFDVQKPLCVCLNDIEYIRRVLEQLSDKLRLSKVVERIESHHNTDQLESQSHFRVVFSTILDTATQSLLSKILVITKKVADRMRPDIKKNVFRLTWLSESQNIYQAIEPLINYLDQNLHTVYKYLLRRNFKTILSEIWQECLEEFKDIIQQVQADTQNSAQVKIKSSEQIQNCLDLLWDFFNADNKGLLEHELNTKYFMDLYWCVKMQKFTTKQLITQFFNNMIEQQGEYKTNTIGVIGVKSKYNPKSELLTIEVNYCKKIIALDSNGLSDPYIVWDLCPPHLFPGFEGNKTTIKKKTLNPIYDEVFEIVIAPRFVSHAGVCIRFTLMDYNFVIKNDFGGESYLSFNRIPGVPGAGAPGAPDMISTTRPTELVFMKPQTLTENKSLMALTQRSHDDLAKQFVANRVALAMEAEEHINEVTNNHSDYI